MKKTEPEQNLMADEELDAALAQMAEEVPPVPAGFRERWMEAVLAEAKGAAPAAGEPVPETEKPAPKEPAPAVTDAVKETVPEKAVKDPVQTIREQQPEGTEAVIAGSDDVLPESVLSGTSGPAEPSSDSAEAAVKDAVPVKSKPAVKRFPGKGWVRKKAGMN